MNNDNAQNLRQQLEDYEKLLNVLQTIGSSLEVEAILRQIIEAALSLCNAQQGAIMLFDPDSHAIVKTLIRQSEPKGSCSIIISIRCFRDGCWITKRRK